MSEDIHEATDLMFSRITDHPQTLISLTTIPPVETLIRIQEEGDIEIGNEKTLDYCSNNNPLWVAF